MRSMIEYIDAASDLLSSLWGNTKDKEVRSYIKRWHPAWTPEEQEELLTLATTLAHWQAEGVQDVVLEFARSGREFVEVARKTSVGLGRHKIRAGDRRKAKHRAAVIERHFGGMLRGEVAYPNGIEDAT